MQRIYSLLIIAVFMLASIPAIANSKQVEASTYKGFITNKKYKPIKLRVSKLNMNSFFLVDRNLEDNAFVPTEDLSLTATISDDYAYEVNDTTLHLPKETQLAGSISNIEPSKIFNRKGFFEVNFDQVICPDGHTVQLKEKLTSKSTVKTYHPLRHVGKSVASVIGGSIAGSLAALHLGGIIGAVSTNGSSIATGAAAGGFVGILHGLISKGKEASIQPGSELVMAPIDETSLAKLSQITCQNHSSTPNISFNPTDINVEVLSIKERKDFLGDTSVMIDIKFTNNSNEPYRLNNLFLRDSTGKEYSPSIINTKQDFLTTFPPRQTTRTKIEFFVNYPKTIQTLVLKDNQFSNDMGQWALEVN